MGQRTAIYARVSTADQCCERQIGELTAFAERGGFEVLGVFKETASGARDNRLARNRVLELAQARRIDAVLVTELSRWGRSTQDLLETLHKLAGWKVSVVAMSGMTFELDTPHGRMMATMLAGVAQFESDLLSERVKSGFAVARARGRKLGRQPGQRPRSDRLAPKVLHVIDGARSYRWIARDLAISKNTVTDIVKRHRANPWRRISPPTGLDPTRGGAQRVGALGVRRVGSRSRRVGDPRASLSRDRRCSPLRRGVPATLPGPAPAQPCAPLPRPRSRRSFELPRVLLLGSRPPTTPPFARPRHRHRLGEE